MKLEGEIGELDLIERLVELGRERFTGAVRFENDGIIKIIYFKGGDVLSASTNDRTDSVDEILLRAGKVSRDHVKQALAKRKENETLGDALLNLGFITKKELTWARRVQVIGVIRSIAAWPAGSFQIVPDYLPKREEGTQFSLPQILVEVVVTDQDRAKFDRALDGGNAVFAKSADFDAEWTRLGLNQDADAIALWIDGTHSASEIASMSGKDAFNVYKLLHALSLLGLVKAQAAPEVSTVGAVADASDAWDFSSTPEPPPNQPEPELPVDPPAIPMKSAFDDDEDIAPPPTLEMPALNFDAEPEPELSVPPVAAAAPPPIYTPGFSPMPTPPPTPAAAADDEHWGFDDAQIEAARRASIPMTSEEMSAAQSVAKASKPGRWVGLLLAAVIIVGVTFGGFAAWNWYQEKSAPPPAPAVVRAKPHLRALPAVVPKAVPSATAETTTTTAAPIPVATTTTATATTATPTTASAAPLMVVKPAPIPHKPIPVPPPATSTTKITESASGTKTISNVGGSKTPAATAPTPSPSTDATRAHYDDMARTFAAQPSGNYTVQFELVCETPSLTRAVKDGGSAVWFVPISYRSRSCYRVFWGHFTTQDEAKRAANEIPLALRGGASPVVVKVPR